MAIAETEVLTRMIAGAALSRVICTLAELGVADHVGDVPQPVSALAEATGANGRALYRVLRFASAHGVFQEGAGQHFGHTALSRALRTDEPGSFRAAGRMFHRIFAGWEGLHHAVVTGEPSFERVYGQTLFGFVAGHPDLGPIFDAGMSSFHGHETAAMLEAYDFTGIRTLADIGGGNGSVLGATLQRYPDLRGMLFDLGHVTDRTRANLEALGVADRCTVLQGNFFDAVPPGADAYLMRHIIHDWTDEQSVQILTNVRKVVPADGRVLIVEFSMPPANEAGLGKDADMVMLAFPGGLERTTDEYAELYRQSGFELTRVVPTASAVCVVEGLPV